MPEPETLFRRNGLGDDHAVNLPIVLDDGHKLPNGLAPTHPTLQRIENIFKPVSVGRRGDLSPLRSGYPRRESQARDLEDTTLPPPPASHPPASSPSASSPPSLSRKSSSANHFAD